MQDALFASIPDFDLVEDVLQDAFLAAIEYWPVEGIPIHPTRWLYKTAQRKAIDRLLGEIT